MAQQRHHYERAFAEMLRRLRVPFVSVNEARRALLPGRSTVRHADRSAEDTLKNFDFVLYGQGVNLLVDIKGRRLPIAATQPPAGPIGSPSHSRRSRSPRLESWVNRDDVRSMRTWAELFGPGFEPVFVFLYASARPPAGRVFDEVCRVEDRWYAPRVIGVGDYARCMKQRSERWGTVHLDREAFEALSGPLVAACDPNRGGGAPQAAAPIRASALQPCPASPVLEPLAGSSLG